MYGRATKKVETLGWSDCGHGDGCVASQSATYDESVDGFVTQDGQVVTVKSYAKTTIELPGECNDPSHWRPGLVLDPFAGTGTTLAVAHGHGRDAIGIDIDERSAELARDRVGPLFLEVS